jgi:Fe-S cluster biosynthesis and repair protein YggX
MTRMIQCVKLGREAEGLDRLPYPGPLGQRIFENVSKTMLVNENRLNLADLAARKYLATQMENYFFGTGTQMPEGYTPQK